MRRRAESDNKKREGRKIGSGMDGRTETRTKMKERKRRKK